MWAQRRIRPGVLTGFNTEIEYGGVVYHVQTEDRVGVSPLIETLVYVKGEILADRRTEYRDLLEASGGERSTVQVLMERQHRSVVEAIRSGRIDMVTAPQVGDAGDTTLVRRTNPLAAAVRAAVLQEPARAPGRSLDEVIADWLAEQQQAERIQLSATGGQDLYFGKPFSLSVRVQTEPGNGPVPGVQVVARLLSTTMKPVVLASAETDPEGVAALAGEIPEMEKGTALLVLTARHAKGADEVKFLVRR